MNNRILEILEYPRIREIIAGFCMSTEGQSFISERIPLIDEAEINRLKSLSAAWTYALQGESPPPLQSWPPVGGFLPKLRVEGASLDTHELYSLGVFCECSERIRQWAQLRDRQYASGRRDSLSDSVESRDAPVVREILAMPDVSAPLHDIFRVIDRSTGEVRDLPELKAIRAEIRKVKTDIDRLIGKYLSDDSYKTMLQSNLPAYKDGRQVIALRANFKSRIRGIVHEVSQSGQTVYIEPDDVVDRNNDLVTEEHRLSREIQRILKDLTFKLCPHFSELSEALSRMVFFDGIHASARWGIVNSCVYSESTESILSLVQARHPLLGAKTVPIDLILPPGSRMIIITGPNTGGKTVSLKTAALFAVINQSGWPIPAADGSRLPVFNYIGCDIGDEQSIDQSLSTFSGHMKNVAEILASTGPRSLVLLDELGSGTDPHEGSAIAMAVLDRLHEANALVLVTTHHGILKNYGYSRSGCVNASVDFDQNTLSPTYRILMGVPGESHALDIAARNGLDSGVLEQAKQYLQDERADVSALIKGLTEKHEEFARFEKERKVQEQLFREKKRKTDLKELQLRQKELELREQGYRKLEKLLADSRRQLENLVRELREGELTRDKTLQVKAWMDDLDKQVHIEYNELQSSRERVADFEKKALSPQDTTSCSVSATPISLIPGMEVFVEPGKRKGVLVRQAKKGQWVVAIDNLKMTVAENKICAVPLDQTHKSVTVEIQTVMSGDDSPVFELRLLGMRHDEALQALDRQLDLAMLKGLKEFTIIHGKGNGVLQKAVHERLRSVSGITNYHFARPEDGGFGKTIVTLG